MIDTDLFMECEEEELEPWQQINEPTWEAYQRTANSKSTTVFSAPAVTAAASTVSNPVMVSSAMPASSKVTSVPLLPNTLSSIVPSEIPKPGPGQQVALIQSGGGLSAVALSQVLLPSPSLGTSSGNNQPIFFTTQGFPVQNVQRGWCPMGIVLNIQQGETVDPITLVTAPRPQVFKSVMGGTQILNQPSQVTPVAPPANKALTPRSFAAAQIPATLTIRSTAQSTATASATVAQRSVSNTGLPLNPQTKFAPYIQKSKMGEKLITAVSGFPVLFDTSLSDNKNILKKNEAWRKVVEIVGAPEDVCKRKWKGLRDTYKKEKNKEKVRSRSAAGLADHRPWKFFTLMGFLAPFLEYRETSGNFSQLRTGGREGGPMESQTASPQAPVHEDGTPDPQDSQKSQDQLDSQARESEAVEGNFPLASQTQQVPRPPHQVAGPPSTSSGPPRKRVRKEQFSSFEDRMLSAVEGLSPKSAPPDEDELFFKSLIPTLKRLPLAKRSELKLCLYRMVCEAEREEGLRHSQMSTH